MTDQIDVNQLSNALQNKADLDLGNVSYSKLSGYDFTVSQETIGTLQAYVLNLPKTIDPKKYFVNAYAVVKTAVGFFEVGDIIPFAAFWGESYRNIGFWFNATKLGFGTSNQVSCLPRGTTGGNTSMQDYISVYFDFYRIRD